MSTWLQPPSSLSMKYEQDISNGRVGNQYACRQVCWTAVTRKCVLVRRQISKKTTTERLLGQVWGLPRCQRLRCAGMQPHIASHRRPPIIFRLTTSANSRGVTSSADMYPIVGLRPGTSTRSRKYGSKYPSRCLFIRARTAFHSQLLAHSDSRKDLESTATAKRLRRKYMSWSTIVKSSPKRWGLKSASKKTRKPAPTR